MKNEVALVPPADERRHDVVAGPGFSLAPRNIEEAFRLADMLASSELVPKDYRGKPGNVIVAMQWGMEVGLKPLQALQNIAVINGRPSMWGDSVIALVRASSLCEYVTETWDAAGTAICQVKRRGEAEQVRTFSDADAKTAGLLGKEGPWRTNPKRMKQMRARAFALRDVFADVLKGIAIAEEAMDLPPFESVPQSLDGVAGVAPPVPDDLMRDAKAAAEQGFKKYEEWFKGIGLDNRKLLQFEHPALRARAEAVTAAAKADAEATTAATDTPQAGAPAATGGDLLGDAPPAA